MVNRYEFVMDGNKIELYDTLLEVTYRGELYEVDGREYVKASTRLDMMIISKYRKGLLKG